MTVPLVALMLLALCLQTVGAVTLALIGRVVWAAVTLGTAVSGDAVLLLVATSTMTNLSAGLIWAILAADETSARRP